MQCAAKTIEEYLQVIPEERKLLVEKVLILVKAYFPEIEGTMEYNMPTYNPVCAIASQKNYVHFIFITLIWLKIQGRTWEFESWEKLHPSQKNGTNA